MQGKIPAEFWAELKERKLIEQDAPVPTPDGLVEIARRDVHAK